MTWDVLRSASDGSLPSDQERQILEPGWPNEGFNARALTVSTCARGEAKAGTATSAPNRTPRNELEGLTIVRRSSTPIGLGKYEENAYIDRSARLFRNVQRATDQLKLCQRACSESQLGAYLPGGHQNAPSTVQHRFPLLQSKMCLTIVDRGPINLFYLDRCRR